MNQDNSRYNFNGKVAIVTGSAGGIGKAIATKLTADGATVIVSDVQIEEGEATAKELAGNTLFVPCDITKREQVQTLVSTTVDRFGR